MRNQFEEQLSILHRELITMGTLCEEVIALSSKALTDGDTAEAARVAPVDSKIDQLERDIEAICLRLLLQQQPVARDLRRISAALKMITDMERIGDQAADIADIIAHLGGRTAAECTAIRDMAKATIRMVTDSVEAFVSEDTALAYRVIESDDTVDDAFLRTKTALIHMLSANAADAEYALDLLMIAKYFERIGDHATNIAEWVVFSITGTHPDAPQN